MISLPDACRHVLEHNLAIDPGESVVIVSDGTRPQFVSAFERGARALEARVSIVEIPEPEYNGQEPPADAATAMRKANVVLMPLARSLSWTVARREATAAGARIASMPYITEEIALRTFPVDYRPIRERANEWCDRLDRGMSVHITTASGTDLTLGIDDREAHGRKGGIYRSPGHWGNLPCGEAFIAPVEGSAHGVYVVDASQAGVGKVEQPIRITVENGLAVRIEGGADATKLDETLRRVNDPRAYNIAELGIGCNHAARIIGVTLEDEKALDTCHIALGRNDLFGGTVDVGIHLDGIVRRPRIRIDNEDYSGSDCREEAV